ncbi:MAG: hypothetical protein VW985_00795 [Gammaproteobacteria bacterium]
MSNTLLPGAFAQLESFATDWCIADEASRNRKRLASTMSEIRAFYKAALPQIEPIVDYLRPKPLAELDPQDRNLFNLALSFMEVAPAIEIYFEPDVPNSFEPDRFKILPPFAQTAVGGEQHEYT